LGDVLIVDDDPGFREYVAKLFERAGLEADVVGRGEEALELVSEDPPGLAILDVCLPDVSGYEICRVLRERFGENLPIIFVSGERTESYDRTAGLFVGADDYVVKPFDPDELLARARRALARSRANGEKMQQVVNDPALTRRELEVLSCLVEGMRPRQIAHEMFISEKTVSSHIQHIFAKLNVHSQAEAVAVAFRNGLVTPARLALRNESPDIETRFVFTPTDDAAVVP
jgi:DNA-binding NarL/FixJ family response regulator